MGTLGVPALRSNTSSIPEELWASVSLLLIWGSESPLHGSAARLKMRYGVWELPVSFEARRKCERPLQLTCPWRPGQC